MPAFVSHRYRLIFVHVHKCAGTYMRGVLKGLDPHCRRISPDPHVKPAEIRKLVGARIWKSYTKFAVVRNSWDWTLSLLSYIKEHPGHPQHSAVLGLSLSQYLQYRKDGNDTVQQSHYTHCPRTGKQIVDRVLRFENLHSDLRSLFASVGAAYRSRPKKNASRRTAGTISSYSAQDHEIIEELFARDIHLFGFTRPSAELAARVTTRAQRRRMRQRRRQKRRAGLR